ncbi:g138 [Coccomyxa viridis]|uniref:G138 protein n=1 Tax=Coccomyxa viridis TaxID=1274662 RepID=A0ABP1FLI1_9CHLO
MQTLTMLLALKFIAWLVEVGGLLSLHKSCKDGFHPSLDFYHYAQLPQANSCGKILRYLHWATWLQLPLVLALFSALLGWFGGSRVTLGRFRMAFIGLLAVACALEMWAANVVLNLAGTHKLRSSCGSHSDATLFLSSTEVTRAKIALCGYCISAAFNALLIITLGDEGEAGQYAGSEAGLGVDEPLRSP